MKTESMLHLHCFSDTSSSSSEKTSPTKKSHKIHEASVDYFSPNPRAKNGQQELIGHYGVRLIIPKKTPNIDIKKSTPAAGGLCSLSPIPKGGTVKWDYQRQEIDPKRPGFGRQPISAFGYDFAKIPVRYFTAAEKEHFRVFIRDSSLVNAAGENVITDPNAKEHLFIVDKDDKMYVFPVHHKMSAFLGKWTGIDLLQHSSGPNGEDVKFAGTIKTIEVEGLAKVSDANNDSGHYKPTLDQFSTILKHLQDQGVLAEGIKPEFLDFKSRKEITHHKIDLPE